MHTTNGQKRLSQEMKRRTREVPISLNREFRLRLITALVAEQSEE